MWSGAADGSAEHTRRVRFVVSDRTRAGPVRAFIDTGKVIETRHGPSFERLYADAVNRVLSERGDWYSVLVDRLPDPPGWAEVVVDLRVQHQDHSDLRGAGCQVSGGVCDNGRADPLPESLGEPVQVWESHLPGWVLEGFVVDMPHRRTQVLRFTDPDGFRCAVVASGKDAKRSADVVFEAGRFTAVFPTADHLLRPAQRHYDETGMLTAPDSWLPLQDAAADATAGCAGEVAGEVAAIAHDRYRLPVLRDAMRDPAGWFGLGRDEGWQDLTCPPSPAGPAHESSARWLPDSMGPHCPVGPDRVLLAYAMAGVSSYASVQQFVSAGLDPAEVGRWREHGFAISAARPSEVADGTGSGTGTPTGGETTGGTRDETRGETRGESRGRISDEEIIDWFSAVGGGSKARANMVRFSAVGLDAAQAARWTPLGRRASQYAHRIPLFESAGWDAEDVLRVQRAALEMNPSVPLHLVAQWEGTYAEGEPWTFISADTAVAFMACGYTPETARAAMHAAEDPAKVEAAVMTLAALRKPVGASR